MITHVAPSIARLPVPEPPALDPELDLVARYTAFRTAFQSWSPDRQQRVIAVAWERWQDETDSELKPLIAEMANDLESLAWFAGNGHVVPCAH